MSLIESKYLTPARERHGAHYYAKLSARWGDMRMAMTMCNPEPSAKDKVCDFCFRTPFSNDTKICPRCGHELK